MVLKSIIDLFSLKDQDVVFWSSGNEPTQKIYSLSKEEILLHIKALYLLSDKIIGSGSFFFESIITREIVCNKNSQGFDNLFKNGSILFFTEEHIDSFTEHGLRKMERSPESTIAYKNKKLVIEMGKYLDSIGNILRRPSIDISNKIVELWIKDLLSDEPYSLGGHLKRNVKDKKRFNDLRIFLIKIAQSRDKDFVWEFLYPELKKHNFSKPFIFLCRKRLAQMYGFSTAELLGVYPDRIDFALASPYITLNSKYDSSLFIFCMEILGVLDCLKYIDYCSLKKLKDESEEFRYFKNFYFRMIEATANVKKDINIWLPIYRDAERKYAQMEISYGEFLDNFQKFCRTMKTPQKKYSRPIELLIATYDNFNLLPINDFIERIRCLSINADYEKIKRIIIREDIFMEPDKRARKRLHDLDDILTIEYERLASFQKDLAIRSDPAIKYELKQRILHECLPNIRKYENEYAQILFSQFPILELSEAESKTILSEIMTMIEAIERDQEAAKNKELIKIVTDVKHQLYQPNKMATAKLKATIPIIPGVLKYEFELDTENTVFGIWKKIKSILRINS
jgi:hypothetical protein